MAAESWKNGYHEHEKVRMQEHKKQDRKKTQGGEDARSRVGGASTKRTEVLGIHGFYKLSSPSLVPVRLNLRLKVIFVYLSNYECSSPKNMMF